MAWPPATHQDVEDDLTNGHGWAGSLSERFGLGELLLPTPAAWTSGDYYGSASTGAASTSQSSSANRMYLSPLYFPIPRTVDQIGIQVTTAGTVSHVARLGIYNSDPSTGLPSTVKVDAGTVAVDSTGAKSLTISATLDGLYWLAATSQSGSFTFSSASALVPLSTGSLTGSPAVCFIRASTAPTSALPNLVGDATVSVSTFLPIRVLVRAV